MSDVATRVILGFHKIVIQSIEGIVNAAYENGNNVRFNKLLGDIEYEKFDQLHRDLVNDKVSPIYL